MRSTTFRYAGNHLKAGPVVFVLMLSLCQYVFWKEFQKPNSPERTETLLGMGLGSAFFGGLLLLTIRMKLKKPVFMEIDDQGVRAPGTGGQTVLWRDIVEIRHFKDLWLHEHLLFVVANDKEYLERLSAWARLNSRQSRRSNGTVFSCLITSLDKPAEEIKSAVLAAWNAARQAIVGERNSSGALPGPAGMDSTDVRRSAWRKAGLGLFGSAALAAVVMALSARGVQFKNPFYFIPLAVPFVYFSIGIVELIAGVSMDCLSEKWMSLKGWQRGLLGTFIILLSMVGIFAVVALAITVKAF